MTVDVTEVVLNTSPDGVGTTTTFLGVMATCGGSEGAEVGAGAAVVGVGAADGVGGAVGAAPAEGGAVGVILVEVGPVGGGVGCVTASISVYKKRKIKYFLIFFLNKNYFFNFFFF